MKNTNILPIYIMLSLSFSLVLMTAGCTNSANSSANISQDVNSSLNSTAVSEEPAALEEPTIILTSLEKSTLNLDAEVFDNETDQSITYKELLEYIQQLGTKTPVDLHWFDLTIPMQLDIMNISDNTEYLWNINIDNITVDSKAEEIDISGHDIAGQHDYTIDELFSLLPDLKRIDMCNCGYSNDEMAALDIGHNHVGDISFLQYLPNLRVLILVDNVKSFEGDYIRYTDDLSVLSYLPELRYLEFFVGSVKDLSFLQYTPKLVDLNISYSPDSDASPLYNLPNLERLMMEHTNIPYEDYVKLTQSYPNAQIEYYGEGSIDHGWREHPRYFIMRDMFNNNYLHDIFK